MYIRKNLVYRPPAPAIGFESLAPLLNSVCLIIRVPKICMEKEKDFKFHLPLKNPHVS